jgi:DNA modification methylase
VRRLKPERKAKALEAKNLREFGYTQQEIADALEVPRQTISRWLTKVGNGHRAKVGNGSKLLRMPATTLPTINITLYPCRYEAASIPNGTIDFILTDPPYLVSSNDITRTNQACLKRDYGQWDKSPVSSYKAWVRTWAKLMASHLKPGGSIYLFTGFKQISTWQAELENSGLQFAGILLWHRINPAPQIRKTRWCPAFDFILYFTKGTPKTFIWLGQNEMHNVITGPICAGAERDYHPTQKPRWLLQKLIQVSSKPGDTILDPFAGSGSTAFAASRLPGRRAVLIEPEPRYYGLIQGIAKNEFGVEVTVHGNGHDTRQHQ